MWHNLWGTTSFHPLFNGEWGTRRISPNWLLWLYRINYGLSLNYFSPLDYVYPRYVTFKPELFFLSLGVFNLTSQQSAWNKIGDGIGADSGLSTKDSSERLWAKKQFSFLYILQPFPLIRLKWWFLLATSRL